MTITAKVVCDSISPRGIRLTTLELRYPRFIHAEFMTHRQFSRNASSSRAIPVERLIADVEMDPAVPIRWGLNGKGMQDHGEMSPVGECLAYAEWIAARDAAVRCARRFLRLREVPHKQIVNRIIEPFSHITVLVTATEWDNFFKLRRHPSAQPEIQKLADDIYIAMAESDPVKKKPGEWHVPYITDTDVEATLRYVMDDMPSLGLSFALVEEMAMTILCNISVARCARVSYLRHDGKKASIDEELALFLRLMGEDPKHASPAEHQATPDGLAQDNPSAPLIWEEPELHGNFVGWKQYRKMFVGESVVQNARTIKEVIHGKNRFHV